MSHTLDHHAPIDLWRRVAITLAALLVIDLMARIPLPGINLAFLMQPNAMRGGFFGALAENNAWARLSIGALNITPIFAAFFIFELWRTISGKMYGGDLAVPNQARVLQCIVGAALLLAAFQAWGIAVALEQIQPGRGRPLVTAPGLEFRLAMVACLVGATAVVAWLMTIISRDGIGSGLWILFAAATLHQWPAGAAQVYELSRNGAISSAMIWIFLALIVAATALLVALSLGRPSWGCISITPGCSACASCGATTPQDLPKPFRPMLREVGGM
jgi:preprotein translocase subunit SecY